MQTETQGEGSPRPQSRGLRGWRPPFYYGWVIIGVVFLGEFAATGLGSVTVGLFYTPMHEALGWSLTGFTGAITAASIAGIVIAPLLGRLLDRFGARPIMLVGALAGGVGLILISQVRELWQFWVLYAVVAAMGLHELGSFTAPVIVSKWFVRLRGRAMVITTYGTVAGSLVMTPVVGLLIVHAGWRQTWLYMGVGLLIVMVPLVWLFVRRQPEDMGLTPDGDPPVLQPPPQQGETGPARHVVEVSWTLREALRPRTLWLLVLALNLASFLASVQTLHLAPFLTQQAGLSAGTAAFILTVRQVGVAVFRLPWGFIIERVPIRYCLAIAFVSRSLGVLSLILVPFPTNIVLFVILAGIGGVYGLLQPLAFANYYGRESLGTIQGVIRPFLAVPNLVGPITVALLFDAIGTFDIAFITVSSMGFLAGGVVLFAFPPVHPAATHDAAPGRT